MQLSMPAAQLLSWIPLSARTILDIGCGNGELAAAYRRMNPRARLLGIERDPLAVALAAPHLDHVATMDVEADPLPFDTKDGIDCIIYNDVLHYLDDPWALVRRHAEVLRQDGIMLICVPNIEYWRLTERRLRGAWDEDAAGWYRHRHGQWLNIAGIRENLVSAGLTSCDVTTREPDETAAKAFCDSLAPGLSAIGIDPQDYARRASASHLICRALKDPIRQMIISGNMLTPVGGVSHVRVVHPLHAVGSDPAVTTAVTDRVTMSQPAANSPRIFVLHRPTLMGEAGLDMLRKLTDAGYLIVTEFDDHPDHSA